MSGDAGEERREIVAGEEAGGRLDAWLAERTGLSRSRAAQLIEEGRVLLNGKPARKSERPAPGDVAEVRLPAPEPSEISPEDLPLDVVYQDADLLVINKAAGMVVHPAAGHRTGTLVNALLHSVRDLSGIGGVMRPGIVHRLDRETSGLMLVAKSDDAHRALSDALKARRIRRVYLVAAWGHLMEGSRTVDAPIDRHPTERKRMAVVPGGRRAVTHFRVVERWKGADLLRAELETGRTHQIRVHLVHAGHPVVGDRLYAAGRERGAAAADRAWANGLAKRVHRQFLHATELRFVHPRTGEEMRFEAPLPPDLEAAAAWARAKTAVRAERAEEEPGG
jgi:23S rRNA pseudouridine1911/1915/1917 synthase